MNNKTSNIYPWVVVGLLWGVALLNYMDRQMLSTMRIPMMEDVRELESAANFMQEHINPWWNADFGPLSH